MICVAKTSLSAWRDHQCHTACKHFDVIATKYVLKVSICPATFRGSVRNVDINGMLTLIVTCAA